MNNKQLSKLNKDLKADCHKYLDTLWHTRQERRAIYKWLARKMNLPLSKCHISQMNTVELYRARAVLRQESVKRRKKKR